MEYRYCGKRGLKFPLISLGLWHNFGDVDDFATAREMICHAFDQGITHFDLANNYGPPPGSAERNFGKIFREALSAHRDEMIVSSKAGHAMWNGPYGDGGSRKSILASIDQSLKRTGLEYFDIFYSHRYDPEVPLEETVQALIDIVKQGKALYIGLSKYPADKAEAAYRMMEEQRVPCLAYQGRYNLLERTPEKEIFPLNEQHGVGYIAFSPLAQGVLTDRYLNGIPETSRVAKGVGFLTEKDITRQRIAQVNRLNEIARRRNQSLAQMALAWLLATDKPVTSVVVGASSVNQLDDNLQAIRNLHFSKEELSALVIANL